MAHGLGCSTACGISPDQGLNLCPLHWQADSQPLHHQGSPFFNIFIWQNKMLVNSCQTNVLSVLLMPILWTWPKGTENIWPRLLEFDPCVWAPPHPAQGGILRWCVQCPGRPLSSKQMCSPPILYIFPRSMSLAEFQGSTPSSTARIP